MMDEASLTPRQQSWWGHLRAGEASGLSAAATARREGLRIGSLYESRHRLSVRQIKSFSAFSFVQFKTHKPIMTPPISDSPRCRVFLPNGVRVETADVALSAVLAAAGQWS